MRNMATNFDQLARNPYPGPGVIVGTDETDEYLIQIHWITEQSDKGKNRAFGYEREAGRVFTEPADPTKPFDPALTTYNVMAENPRDSERRVFVVSSGHQTDVVLEGYSQRGTVDLRQLIPDSIYELDAPNYPPRITGLCYLGRRLLGHKLAIIRRKSNGSREYWPLNFLEEQIEPGTGYGFISYSGNGNPLPTFEGGAMALPLRGGAIDIMNTYWRALNEAHRVAIAVKFIRIVDGKSTTVIQNRFARIPMPVS